MYCVFKKPHCISKHRRLRRGRDKNSQNMAYKIKSKLIGDKFINSKLKLIPEKFINKSNLNILK